MARINSKEELINYIKNYSDLTTSQLEEIQKVITTPELIKISSFYKAEPSDIRHQTIDLYKFQKSFNLENFYRAIDKKQIQLRDLEQLLTLINNNQNITINNYFKRFDILKARQEVLVTERGSIESYSSNAINLINQHINIIKERNNSIILKIDKIILTKKHIINNSVDKYFAYYKQVIEGYNTLISNFSVFYSQNISIHNSLVSTIQSGMSSMASSIGQLWSNTNMNTLSVVALVAGGAIQTIAYYVYLSLLFAEKDAAFTWISNNYAIALGYSNALSTKLTNFTYVDQYLALLPEITTIGGELQTSIAEWTTIMTESTTIYADIIARYQTLIGKFGVLTTDYETFSTNFLALIATLRNSLILKEDAVFQLKSDLYEEINTLFPTYNVTDDYYNTFREYYDTKV
ncbi:hypothetical protein [uncultured archaeal virus]|uniref:Uncharacterized protein n=1 Tax=uncultured archaeal virus TaxID=1960247 RepID=A0A8B0LNC3_9VIRU|nr:hypothetical protein [uncultured archaeal virus]